MAKTGDAGGSCEKVAGGRCCATVARRRHRAMAMLAVAFLIGMALPALAAPAKLAATRDHGVALHNDGTVWSWGGNEYGQLGNGTTIGNPVPARVPGVTGIVSVAVGEVSTHVLKEDGTVWGWGSNGSGQLGNGSYVASSVPVRVSGLTGVVSIGAGNGHVLAVKSDGSVWAWGSNWRGQLGNGSVVGSLTPVRVQGLSGITAVAGGEEHSIALRNDGTVWCWGGNSTGQLGQGWFYGESAVPLMVPGLSGVTAVAAAGSQSFALRSDGSVRAWGGNGYGQLGDGSKTNRATPVRVAGLPGPVAALASSRDNTVALLADGTVWYWGFKGILEGHWDYDDYLPEQEPGITGITAVASGGDFMLALERDGTINAWGDNRRGQLGAGILDQRLAPLQVAGVAAVSAISSCSSCNYTLALKNDGTVWSWGGAPLRDTFIPVQVAGASGVSRIAAGVNHRLALKADGTVWAWGENENGQLGNGGITDSSIPVQVVGLGAVSRIAAGGNFSLAATRDGTVWSWGSNENGALGDGAVQQTNTPMQVPGLSAVVDVAAGERYGMALQMDGTVWVWGVHQYGSGFSSTPVAVALLPPASRIAAGSSHSLAMLPPGSSHNLWSWGTNSDGELGDGTTITKPAPVAVRGLPDLVKAIAAGSSFSLAVQQRDGSVLSWGLNDFGQLGTGSTTSTTTATRVLQLYDVVELAAGHQHSAALKGDGTVWTWGRNNVGQLGSNPGLLPVQALVNLGPQEEVTLSVAVTGNGMGSVHSFPSGIACTAGTCTGSFLIGTDVTLHASSGSGSFFAGWGGACSGLSDCLLEMNSAKSVTASFAVAYPLRIGGSGYSTLAAAYAAAPAGALIMSRDGDLLEGLLADRNVAVKLSGGYYTNFSGRSGLSTRLRGKLLVRRGTLRVDRIKVM